jgi:hypothetical protein
VTIVSSFRFSNNSVQYDNSMCLSTIRYYYAIDAVTETGDDIFNEAELNEIKIDGNHEIFEVPEPNGKLRRRTHN